MTRMSTSSTRQENEGSVVYRSKLGMEFCTSEKLGPVKHSASWLKRIMKQGIKFYYEPSETLNTFIFM